ncbi:MAG: hypothetical protein HDS24_01450 [Bacteroides sp.]|nr:hypothetical protein [Bacteroides sp.]
MDNSEIIKLVSDGVDRAKAGKALEVFASVAPLHDNDSLPVSSHYAFAWIIYYALHQSPAKDILGRKRLLARYFSLNVKRPHKQHSMILTEAIRLHGDASALSREVPDFRQKDTPRFSIVRFMELWDFANLRPGDWRRKENEGKLLPSTVEKLATAYINELAAENRPAPEPFMAIARRILEVNSPGANQYAQMGRLCELAGNREEAREFLRKALLCCPTKPYLWSRLASLLEERQHLKLRVALLYKALSIPGPEDFKGRVRLKMAETLANGAACQQAAWELMQVKNNYERNGWNLPAKYAEVRLRIPADTLPVDPTPAYRRTESLADDYLVASLPLLAVAKTYHKAAADKIDRYGRKRKKPVAWRVTDESGAHYWFEPSAFGLSEDLPIGTKLQIRLFGGKVVGVYIEECDS